jgi:hypothetical protein
MKIEEKNVCKFRSILNTFSIYENFKRSDQIDCQFIDVFLLTDEKNYTRYIDLHSKCKNIVLTNSLPNFKVKHQVALFKINKEK